MFRFLAVLLLVLPCSTFAQGSIRGDPVMCGKIPGIPDTSKCKQAKGGAMGGHFESDEIHFNVVVLPFNDPINVWLHVHAYLVSPVDYFENIAIMAQNIFGYPIGEWSVDVPCQLEAVAGIGANDGIDDDDDDKKVLKPDQYELADSITRSVKTVDCPLTTFDTRPPNFISMVFNSRDRRNVYATIKISDSEKVNVLSFSGKGGAQSVRFVVAAKTRRECYMNYHSHYLVIIAFPPLQCTKEKNFKVPVECHRCKNNGVLVSVSGHSAEKQEELISEEYRRLIRLNPAEPEEPKRLIFPIDYNDAITEYLDSKRPTTTTSAPATTPEETTTTTTTTKPTTPTTATTTPTTTTKTATTKPTTTTTKTTITTKATTPTTTKHSANGITHSEHPGIVDLSGGTKYTTTAISFPTKTTSKSLVPTKTTSTSLIPTKTTPTSLVPTKTTSTSLLPTKTTSASLVPTKTTPTSLLQSKTTSTSLAPTKTTPKTLAPNKTTPKSLLQTKTTSTSLAPTKTTPKSLAPTKTTPKSLAPTITTPKSLAPTKTTPKSLAPTKTTPKSLLQTKTTSTSLIPTKTTPTSLVPTKTTPTSLVPTKTTPTSLVPTKTPKPTIVPKIITATNGTKSNASIPTVPKRPTQPPIPPNTATIMKEIPKNVMYNECGRAKGCIGQPPGCLATRTCSSIVSSSSETDKAAFQLLGKSEKYVAMGFSDDKFMGHDSVIECVRESGNEVRAYRSYNTGNKDNKRLKDHSPISGLKAKYSKGEIYCEFLYSRLTIVEFEEKNITYDLEKDSYYIIYADGQFARDGLGGNIGYHSETFVGEQKLNLLNPLGKSKTQLILEKIHGITMIVVWFGIYPVSNFLPRYFKETWTNVYIREYSWWYLLHIILSGLTVFLTSFATLGISITVHGWGGDPWVAGFHMIAGYITNALIIFDVLLGYVAAKLNANFRFYFINFMHGFIGHVVFFLSYVITFLSRNMTSGMPCKSTSSMITFMIFVMTVHLGMSYQVCYTDFVQGRHTSRVYYSCGTLDLPGKTFGKDAPGTLCRKVMIVVFVVLCLVYTLILCVLYGHSKYLDCEEERRIRANAVIENKKSLNA